MEKIEDLKKIASKSKLSESKADEISNSVPLSISTWFGTTKAICPSEVIFFIKIWLPFCLTGTKPIFEYIIQQLLWDFPKIPL